MPSRRRFAQIVRVRSRLALARIGEHHVQIERRKRMDDLNGYVMGAGTTWALLAVLTEGREPNGYELVRLEHVKRVRHLRQWDEVERRILRARGHWPLPSLDVDLDETGALLHELSELYPVMSFHTEEKWPDMMWVGSVCRRTGHRTWYHALDPQAQWLPELESFKTRRLTRISVGGDYVARLVLVADPSPAGHHR